MTDQENDLDTLLLIRYSLNLALHFKLEFREPISINMQRLHGLSYLNLPIEVKRSFDRTTIRFFHVTDYDPEEPAEIFFRLNQPTALSSAEKRNAFFGPVRKQIRELVPILFENSATAHILGFSNSRMAYDDLLARFAYMLEIRSFAKKVTANSIDMMYRRKDAISFETESRLRSTLKRSTDVFSAAKEKLGTQSKFPKLNKATTLSWLAFFTRAESIGETQAFADFFLHFEFVRQGIYEHADNSSQYKSNANEVSVQLLLIYNDRATARVADVSSVLLRDFILWFNWREYSGQELFGSFENASSRLGHLSTLLQNLPINFVEDEILNFIQTYGWGSEI